MSTNDINIYALNLDGETVNQIHMIAKHPSIVGRVAIQPDAHIGKGCVIGFTGKYEKFICPNFIGVDIGCFTGNTMFMIENGTSSFMELINDNIQKVRVPSFNINKNTVEIVNAHVLKTRCLAEVFKVFFSDGSYCNCTPDHRFLGKNLEYIEIQNVKDFPFELKSFRNDLSIIEVNKSPHYEDVYCLYVPGNNNFFLSNGAVVHNCGVMTHKVPNITKDQIDFKELDKFIRSNIPIGSNNRDSKYEIDKFIKDKEVKKYIATLISEMDEFFESNKIIKKFINPSVQFGTLGGGNHFIECDESESKDVYVTIHTGSRNFGSKIAEFYQKRAFEYCRKIHADTFNKENAYLDVESEDGKNYLKFMKIAQRFSSINRYVIMNIILNFFNTQFSETEKIESIHNYIDDENMIRKGAIKANLNQKVVIPLSMKRGVIIGEGLGNPDYNFSGPHGAGRKHSRTELFKALESSEITMENYFESMEGIFSTSINKGTIDEWDGAYKDNNDILDFIKDTVTIKEIMIPIYNLKA